MPRLVKVEKGGTKPVRKDPEVGDYVVGVNVRPHGPTTAVVHNICVPEGVRTRGQMIPVARNAIVQFGEDLAIGEGIFRVEA